MSQAPGTPHDGATPRPPESSLTTEEPQSTEPLTSARPLPPGPEGFQLLGEETAGYCTDGVCLLPVIPQPDPAAE